MTSWNPNQYLHFAKQRLRPALDLLDRVPTGIRSTVYDLGCGPGTVTAYIKQRWPQAKVTGVDSSEEMLTHARSGCKNIKWQLADLKEWIPSDTPDLLYSNAALHWLTNHEFYFPRLVNLLSLGGVLAVQMPRNFGEPTHTTIFDTIRAHDWNDLLMPLLRENPTHEPSFYYDLLRPQVSVLDIWETIYYQVMHGPNPIVEFTKGSFLRPVLSALNPAQADSFLKEYSDRVNQHYPKRTDGTTILPFRRLFIIAIK